MLDVCVRSMRQVMGTSGQFGFRTGKGRLRLMSSSSANFSFSNCCRAAMVTHSFVVEAVRMRSCSFIGRRGPGHIQHSIAIAMRPDDFVPLHDDGLQSGDAGILHDLVNECVPGAAEGGWGETCAASGSNSSGKTAVTKIRSEQESFMIFLVLAYLLVAVMAFYLGQQVAWVPGAINIHVRAGCDTRSGLRAQKLPVLHPFGKSGRGASPNLPGRLRFS